MLHAFLGSKIYTILFREQFSEEKFNMLCFIGWKLQIWHVASSDQLLQNFHYSPRIKIGSAQGYQVVHRPLMQNIVKMCQRYLNA